MERISLRGHEYVLSGRWRDLPIYRSCWTDSMFADRTVLPFPAILLTEESRAASTGESSWPAPRGNLYLSLPGHPQAISEGVTAWLHRTAPALTVTLSWDEGFGAHRVSSGEFLTGFAFQNGIVGVDIHLNGTYPPGSGHTSLHALLNRRINVDQALTELFQEWPP